MDDKIIVTNLKMLKKKYGTTGVNKIKAAVRKLIAADKTRGIQTRLIALDGATDMKKLKAAPVQDAASPRQNKLAIDGVYRAAQPDYLMILGAVDVIPHQDIANPVFDGVNDEDKLAPSDLPYACDAAYSKRPEDFTGPTRVVGRLPDITGGKDPGYLVGLLETAAGWKSLPFANYSQYLGMSAQVWQGSTRMSLENLFGATSDLQLSPKKGPNWPANLLSRRSHFINCHGAPADFHFYGQQGNNFPIAHDASLLKGNISEGTVVAAECCYGAELYDPALADGQAGMGNTYLANKAYGFFGSSTIAYGPADGNGSADLLCQFYLKRLFEGASSGRAALQARQDFIESEPQLGPVDLKTLVQFNLLGDPSITPVNVPAPHSAIATTAATRGLSPAHLNQIVDRTDRRQQLAAKGLWLAQNKPVASRVTSIQPSSSVQATLKKLAEGINLQQTNTLSYDLKNTPSLPRGMKAKAGGATAIHVVLGTQAVAAPKSMTRGAAAASAETAPPPKIKQVVALVAKEVDGKIVAYKELHSR